MANPVTYADLDRFLAEAGFRVTRPNQSTVLYKSQSTDVFFAFSPREPKQTVDPFHLWSVRKMLVERGIREEEDFERWLCQIRFSDDCDESARPLVGSGHARGAH
jgi:hypothetical protein